VHLRGKYVSIFAISAIVVGCVMLLIAGIVIVKGDSSNAAKDSGRGVFVPYGTEYTPPPDATSDTKKVPGYKTGGSQDDPFASGYGDTSTHRVTVTVRGDGPLLLSYQYRGRAKKIANANRTFSNSASIDGPYPLAQVFLQVMSPSTFTTCTITVDGSRRVSYTAKGVGHFAVCTA